MAQILTSKEFIVTGLLQEGPCYGYEIEQKIESRGMREWTRIGFSSIYHVLGKLKTAGYVTQTPNIVNGKLQQVYQLTSHGIQALKDQIRLSIPDVRSISGDFDVAISNSLILEAQEVKSLLNQRVKNLIETENRLEKLKSEKLAEGMPDMAAATILFDRPIALIKAEKEFLQLYIDKF